MPPQTAPVDDSEEEEEIDVDEEEEEELTDRISQRVKVDAKFLGPGKGVGKKPRKGGSNAWGDCRQQMRVPGYEAFFKGRKTTHMCIRSLGDGKSCNTELTLSTFRNSFSTGRIIDHHVKHHPASDVAKAAAAALSNKRRAIDSAMQNAGQRPGGVTPRPAVGAARQGGQVQGSLDQHLGRPSPDAQRAAAARAYIYCPSGISMALFEDEDFREMLKIFSGGHEPVLPSKKNLGEWVDAEFVRAKEEERGCRGQPLLPDAVRRVQTLNPKS